MSTQDIQDSTRGSRKTLMTLQHTATDRENLVGRPSKSLKHQLSQDTAIDVDAKRRPVTSKEKETQANIDTTITADDLCNPEGPSEKYWQVLAEKRQVALQEVLEENEQLRQIIENLKEENAQFKQMLEEANSFVEIIKEELAHSDKDDTGIDVNDVSTADENTENDTTVEPEADSSKTD
ncbi:hypothetical protein JYU34_006006 [Plutella xylostella]|uniref:Uncharacterized protein n=2 Tax=Plutella xylostella TaxID=51655 RepID=A0ABQ7QUS3_PLUXY|nr:uncharacterized protein LOC105393102 isoform X2 [Plutella xylostella]KAG7308773.1 hypothetical protein JYU34_006006 [Plutella xylostella]CAG9101975.1 unnamed protein product [Plutella xylostella]